MSDTKQLEGLVDPLQALKAIAEYAPVAIQIYDKDGYTVYVNDMHRRIVGATPPPSYCVLKDSLLEAGGTLHLIKKAFAGEPTMHPLIWYDPAELKNLNEADSAYTKKFGKKCALESHMIPVFDKNNQVSNVVFIFKDVTAELYMKQERERALKERDDAKALIQNVLDQTPAVIYLKDLDGKYLFANGQYCRIFDLKLDNILGKTDQDLFPAAIANAFQKNDRHVQETNSHLEIEEMAPHSDGTKHTYLSLKFPLHDSKGELFGVCGISTDLTQYRMLERELNTAKRMEAVGMLAGGIAHDFNNILEIILLLSDSLLMKKEPSMEPWRPSLESIKSATQSASLLTRQLLALGRQNQSEPTILDLGTIALGMQEILKNAMGEDIRFKIETSSTVWPIHADPLQIEQVLANLCLNARDAMPHGGTLSVRIRNTTITQKMAAETNWKIKPKAQGDFVELTVTDNGAGMDSEILNHIFEPFFTARPEKVGTGLGLATVYRIIQNTKGNITVESTKDKGSCFRVYFPRTQGKLKGTKTTSRLKDNTISGQGQTILLVEDQGTLRSLTAALLREQGYNVIEARDAKAALDLWEMVANDVDIVMTDVVMAEINGVEMVERMRKDRDLNVLFVSAYSDQKLSKIQFDRKAFHFLEKPYTACGLFKKLREVSVKLTVPGQE